MVPSVNLIGGTIAVLGLAALLYFGMQHSTARPVPVSIPTPVVAPVHRQAPERRPIRRKPVYHRVLKGGKIDGRVSCAHVPQIAYEYSKDQVINAAKQYGLSPAQLSALRVCLN